MRWHVSWGGWVALGILMEVVGLRRGGPLTRTARFYLLGSAAGSALVGAFLAWLGWHWLMVAEGVGIGDGMALLVGAVAGLAGWAHRNRGERMRNVIRAVGMSRTWMWPILLRVVGILQAHGGEVWRYAREGVADLEHQPATGAEKRDAVTMFVRHRTRLEPADFPTWMIHGVIQLALLEARGAEPRGA